MSYILDALKKADAERERGSVPGLHSQPLGQVDDDEDATSRRPVPPAMWLVAGAGICLIAVLSWQLLSRPAAPTAATETPTEQNTQPAQPEPMPAPTSVQTAAEQRAQQPPLAAAPPPVTPPAQADRPPTMAPVALQPSPAMAPPAKLPTAPPPPPPAAMVREAPVRATAQAPQVAPKPTTQAATPAARVPAMSELPDEIKRDLPQLTIGGAMYSDTPSSRMLIINSQVFHEGDQPYQGLVLEEIRLKSAVFRYRGYRYAINY